MLCIDNALQQMIVLEGVPSSWDWPDKNGGWHNAKNCNYFAQKLTEYLSVQKYCGSSNGCMPSYNDTNSSTSNGYDVSYKTIDGQNGDYAHWTEANRYGKMILKNGMMMFIEVSYFSEMKNNYDSYFYNTITVDINGRKKPNRYGYDVFIFDFNDKGLNMNTPKSCKKGANTSDNQTYACSTWIMKHNNMDYKYRDVSSEW